MADAVSIGHARRRSPDLAEMADRQVSLMWRVTRSRETFGRARVRGQETFGRARVRGQETGADQRTARWPSVAPPERPWVVRAYFGSRASTASMRRCNSAIRA